MGGKRYATRNFWDGLWHERGARASGDPNKGNLPNISKCCPDALCLFCLLRIDKCDVLSGTANKKCTPRSAFENVAERMGFEPLV